MGSGERGVRGGAVLVEGAGGGGAAAGGGGGATAGAPHDRGVRAEPGSTTTPCKLISAPCVLYLMPPRPRRTAPLSPGCCGTVLLSFRYCAAVIPILRCCHSDTALLSFRYCAVVIPWCWVLLSTGMLSSLGAAVIPGPSLLVA